jgi:type I restriction enzyme, R subunit
LRQHLDNISLQKLRRNKQLTAADLAALQRILNASGIDAAQLTSAVNANGGLGRFIRKLVGLEPGAVKEAFEKFLSDGSYSANQIRFINLIVDELTKNGTMEPARLFESPFMDIAPTGPDMIFAFPDVEVIVDTLNNFNHNMYPPAA